MVQKKRIIIVKNSEYFNVEVIIFTINYTEVDHCVTIVDLKILTNYCVLVIHNEKKIFKIYFIAKAVSNIN